MTGAQKKSKHGLVLWGLILGAGLGLAAQLVLTSPDQQAGLKWFNDNIASNVGNVFLALIFMVVVPLLFAALVNGVAEIGEVARVGKTGLRALAMTVVLSSIAVGIGLAAVNAIRPGEALSAETRAKLQQDMNVEEAKKRAAVAEEKNDPPVLGLIPRNPTLEATRALTGGLLPFMVFALIFGMALASIEPERAMPVKAFFEGLFLVSQKMIEFAMKLAPIGVFGLAFRSFSTLGYGVLGALGLYVLTVLGALAIHFFVTYPVVLKLVAKRNPWQFFRQLKPVILTAFATSSSNATLPIALKTAEEEVGLPRDTSSFVLTVGATANQNGTALFEGITILFLCQFVGVNLDLGQQLTVMGLSIVAGIGTAGVPGGAWPMIGSIIPRFGVPSETIGVVLGIDRILDMSRTVLNVVGDVTIAACVAQMEGQPTAIPESVD